MAHVHSLSLDLVKNEVSCFICKKHKLPATTALSMALGGSKVEVVSRVTTKDEENRDVVLVLNLAGRILASLLSMESGVLYVTDLTKEADQLIVFQKALYEAFGVANIFDNDDEKLIQYTDHG